MSISPSFPQPPNSLFLSNLPLGEYIYSVFPPLLVTLRQGNVVLLQFGVKTLLEYISVFINRRNAFN